VTGSVELERPGGGGPPDAGTRHGHGADVAVGATAGRSLEIRGRVEPPDSRVTIFDQRAGRRRGVSVTRGGRFTARVAGLRPGANTFRLEARKEGRIPWRLEVRIVRRAASSASRGAALTRVPAADRTPPRADLVVVPRKHGSWRRVQATAVGRDPEGVARVRVSLAELARCGGRPVRRRRYFPPPAIERVKVAPGTALPTVRRRVVRLRIRTCARATLWADVTNAHELESSSAPVRIEAAP
jgi:hypothetical protein